MISDFLAGCQTPARQFCPRSQQNLPLAVGTNWCLPQSRERRLHPAKRPTARNRHSPSASDGTREATAQPERPPSRANGKETGSPGPCATGEQSALASSRPPPLERGLDLEEVRRGSAALCGRVGNPRDLGRRRTRPAGRSLRSAELRKPRFFCQVQLTLRLPGRCRRQAQAT